MADSSSLLLLATKGTVIAFDRATGARLWQTPLSTSWNSGDFVTLVSDAARVYAHSKGSIYCLDLFTGAKLWEDGLAGLGYNLASLCLPSPGGQSAPPLPMAEEYLRRSRSDSSASSHSSG